ncbi:MAG: helix-turn-helix domain-containing protein [Deltaproteobacteria bacterium]|nr:helix-turn-helix domain-containing protein [Deltaproteobacteria bacterium]
MERRVKPDSYDFSVLRELRSRRRVTLESLSDATGISFSTLTRIETNQNQPSLSTLSALATYFGMRPAQLLEIATPRTHQVTESPEDFTDGSSRFVGWPDLELRLFRRAPGEGLNFAPPVGTSQIAWVLNGRLRARVLGQDHELPAGNALRFDASEDSEMKFVEDTEFICLTWPKAR